MFEALKNLDLDALPADAQAVILAAQRQASSVAEGAIRLRSGNAALVEQVVGLEESNAALSTQNAELEALNARLKHFVKELNQVIYGPRSEKLTQDERQLAFEDLEVAQSEAEEQSDTVEMTTPRKKRKPAQRNLGNLPDHLERIEQIIEPDSIVCPCGCGDMVRIGEDSTERLEIIPAQPKVIVTIRPKYACPKKQGGIVQAPAPVHLIEGGLPTEGTLAHIGVSKYADHCPLFRQSQIYARSGLNIDRSTLANWMGKVSFYLTPVVDHMFGELKTSGKLFADETRCPVLDPGRGKTKTGYLWAIARDERPFGGTAPPGVVFCYADGRGGKHATEFLTGFCGTLQVDGYTGYNALTKPGRNSGPVKLAYCWAHARRKLKEVHDRDGSPTEGTLAHIGVSKYADHCPLFRQSQIYARSGLNIDRSTLANWMGKVSFYLTPVVDHMFGELKTSGKLFADETRCPVLDPGRGKTKTGYLWAIARDERPFGGTAPPGVVFCYADGRGGKHATEFLTGFCGTLQVDGYTGYNALTKPGRNSGPVKLAYCWAHARRKLKEVHDRDGSPIAKEGLQRIAKFYKIEEAIRGQSAEQRKAARQEQTKPLMEDFEAWLKTVRSRISAKSRLGEKLSYIAKYMDGLKLFLDDGTVEMDSNVVERAIRPIALNRKNALFAGHDEGGRTWARIASLIETCKLNGVEPYAYLKATLEAIAAGHPAARIDELMPWSFDKQA